MNPSPNFNIIAYFSGGPDQVDALPAEKLTHVIFSFCHLTGNKLTVDNEQCSTTITKLVNLKQCNPTLKVLLALGGWGGCKTCSHVFSTQEAREEFAQSVLELILQYSADGIDLDWEFPAIEGPPDHPYKPEDKPNFTALVSQLRRILGNQYELSFAAGGFQTYLEKSVEWEAVIKNVDRVNVMSYDMSSGNSESTGHHTALYSNPKQKNSADNAVKYLINIGVPRSKIVIGAGFYARVWEDVVEENKGLYQAGRWKTNIEYRDFKEKLVGFELYWDETSKAPYGYDAANKLFATFDDKKSVTLKTQYVMDENLDGIMFWQATLDDKEESLIDVMHKMRQEAGKGQIHKKENVANNPS